MNHVAMWLFQPKNGDHIVYRAEELILHIYIERELENGGTGERGTPYIYIYIQGTYIYIHTYIHYITYIAILPQLVQIERLAR